jgi:MFS transporter, SP family, galactose:H+ symporter
MTQATKIISNHYLFFVMLLVGVGGILYGFDLGVISGALLFIKKSILLSQVETEIIVGAVFAGGLIGTLISGPLADTIGRKLVVGLSAIVFIIGILLVITADGFYGLLLGRIFIGGGVGIVAVAVPLYALELAPTNVRGVSVTVFQLLLTFGIVLAYFIDFLFTASENWRGMFAVVLIPSVVLLVGVLFLPESPRFLLSKGKNAQAREVLLKTRSAADTDQEIKEITASFTKDAGTWSELFSHRFLLPLFVGGSIAILQQLTGVNAFLQYAPMMLRDSGLSSDFVSMLGSIGIGVVNFIVTIIAMCLIDRVGRKPLLLTGLVIVILAEIFSGIVQFLPVDPSIQGTLSLVGLLTFILGYAIGPGVVVWLAMSELFPTRVRGKGLAICLFLNSLGSTLFASFFLTLISSITLGGVFFVTAFFALLYLLVAIFGLPETNARSLEDIQKELDGAR